MLYIKVKVQYISINGIETAEQDLITIIPDNLRTDISPVKGLKVASKDITNTKDESESLFISWEAYD